MCQPACNPLSTGDWGPQLSKYACSLQNVEQIVVFDHNAIVWGVGFGEKVDQKKVISVPASAENLMEIVNMKGPVPVHLGEQKFTCLGPDEDSDHDNFYKFRGDGSSLVIYKPDKNTTNWGVLLKTYKDESVATCISCVDYVKHAVEHDSSKPYKKK